MTLLLLVLLAFGAAAVVSALVWRWSPRSRSPEPPALGAARSAGRALRRHPGLTARLDPGTATGLALTLALLVMVAGGVALGVLAYLVRGDTGIVRFDRSVADWGHEHATPFSMDGLEAVTVLGEPMVVIVLALLLVVLETVRTRSRWVLLFVFCVVAGNGIVTTSVKHLADRVRPSVNPIAETLGPSFPSGHSSWSAAFFAAAALLMSRGRDRRARAAIAGVAAGFAVMVAGSRILLSVHWLSDVIAGVALGAAWFSLCAIAFGGRLLRFGAPAEEVERVARGGDAGTRPRSSSRAPA